MKIISEIILILIGIIVGLIYEDYDKFKNKKIFNKENKNNIIYFFLSGILMIIMSINLEVRYENRFIDNIRLLMILLLVIPISLIDYKKCIIPNKVIVVGIITRVVLYILEIFIDKSKAVSDLKSVGLGLMLILFFAIIGIFFIKNGFGMGDIKLMFMLVLYLGFSSSFSSIFIALIFSLIVAIVLMIRRKKNRKDTLPFAPCILMGMYISVFLSGM